MALDESIAKLAAKDSSNAELLQLRCFAGLSLKQAACVLDIAESTANLDWAHAETRL